MIDWDRNHEEKGRLVSGTSLQEIANRHGFDIPVKKRVMEIGVGKGVATRTLCELGNEVVAVDISKVALNSVSSFVKEVCHTLDIKKIASVDLAFAHLVMQHNWAGEVQRIINDVPLNSKGIFSFQFATLSPCSINENVASYINNCELYFYSEDKMRDIISSTNKTLISIVPPTRMPWRGAVFEWRVAKVRV